MRVVNIKKDTLIRILTENRAKHRDTFLKAQEVFRAEVIKRLDNMLAEAKAGKPVSQYVGLTAPQDQTADYDRELLMLSLSLDDEIELDESEFTQYVQDEWHWKAAWTNSTMSYANGSRPK